MGVRVREKQKGSNEWWVFVSWNGRRKSKRIGSEKAARLFAAKVELQLAQDDPRVFEAPAPSPIVAPIPTFGPFALAWLARHAASGGRHGTHAIYESAITHHLVPYFGERPLPEITATVIEDFIAYLRTRGSVRVSGKGLADASVRSIVMVLALVLRRGVREKVIAASPASDVEWGSRRRSSAGPDPFTSGELRRIIAAARELDGDLATMLEVWARTGARAGEVAALRSMDVDLAAGTVWIRQTFSRGRLGPTKTGQERRVSFALPTLEDGPDWRPNPQVSVALAARLRGLKRYPMDPTAPLFTAPSGAAWSTSSLGAVWHRAVAKAGVRYRTAETLRHTMASVELSRSAPLLFVQRQGGWASATVLLSTYAIWVEAGADPAAPPGHLAAVPEQAERGRTL